MKKKFFIKTIALFITLIAVTLLNKGIAYADVNSTLTMNLTGTDDTSGVTISSQNVDGERYFLLPSGVTEDNMTKTFSQDEVYKTSQSANVASLFFVSADPENKGMNYVNGSPDHSAKAKGMIYMYDKDFKLIYSGEVDALKGRGNTTWGWTDKKPYQIKLENKVDLMNPASGNQKAKTWILLSNPFDPTLIKNTMVYNFAKELGLESTPDGMAVDMYYDGIYRGSYYLCEKVEIGNGRVEINDLEEAVEEANPDVDMDELETAVSSNKYGNEFSYVKGLNDPEDITGGYLLEIDGAYYSSEKSWFHLYDSTYLTSKSPEYLSENMCKYISEFLQETYQYIHSEKAAYNNGTDLFNYIDKETFAKYFLTMEWFDNNDIWLSSTYLYKPENEDKLYAGPVWDCDAIMRIHSENKNPKGWKAWFLGRELLALPEFRKAIQEVYINEMRPIIYDTLFGDTDGDYLKTYEHMKEEISASLEMNDMIWDINDLNGTYFLEETAAANYDSLYSLMQQRAAWFDAAITAESFTENTVKFNSIEAPTLKTDNKNKTIKVTIPKTKCKINNLASTKTVKATNYQIAYRVKGTTNWKTVKTNGNLTYTLKNLKYKEYEVKVRAILTTDAGTKYGNYSEVKTVTIKKPLTSVSLSATSYVYTGKAKKPKVTVKAGTTTLLSAKTSGNKNATVSYSKGRTNVGTYKVTVTGSGLYTGTIVKTFKINPAKPDILNPASVKKNQLTVKWKRVKNQASGYVVKYSTSKDFKKGTVTKTVKGSKTTSLKVSGLKSKKVYYIKVRTYKTVNGKTYYSKWSTVKKQKTL